MKEDIRRQLHGRLRSQQFSTLLWITLAEIDFRLQDSESRAPQRIRPISCHESLVGLLQSSVKVTLHQLLARVCVCSLAVKASVTSHSKKCKEEYYVELPPLPALPPPLPLPSVPEHMCTR